jgi:drug/metabolite transporter (DMT)-like permease
MRWQVVTAYFLIYVVWGSTYFLIGVAIRDFPPFLLGAFRFTAAGLLLLAWCFWRGEKVFKRSLIRKSMISGIVLLFIDMAVVMLAQQYLSSSFVAIVASSTAIWIMAFDARAWRHNFRNPFVVAGIVIGFMGVTALYVEQLLSDAATNRTGGYGVLILVLGCISWALGTLYAKYRSSKEEEVNAFAGSAWQMIFAAVMFWLCATVNGDVTGTDLAGIASNAWFALVYLVVFGSILAYSAYVWLLKVRPATEVGTHAYVNPFIAVFIGVTVGGEQVSYVQIAGLVVILLSVAMVGRGELRIKK